MNTYEERVKKATKEQKIDLLVDELSKVGIKSESAQTGGFTMCAYIELLDGKYIYANLYGASLYNSDDYEDDIKQYDDEQLPEIIAGDIKEYLEKKEA